ncbi:hypothetical protein HPB48_015973 [Haemaphysalis longicornis]|uniref:Sodium/calcium exchanger membrane region domain-containing protein n=1 Tax=Haemaphysalis longicornis TaxID=44386 RepID=A0A9J6G6W6_HAELO|nr:hypothetical protein HPB48_015973 [Haemaphysalis longicornis]
MVPVFDQLYGSFPSARQRPGSFITEGDIGLGTIVGSAVFNVLGVTGVAGLAVWKNLLYIALINPAVVHGKDGEIAPNRARLNDNLNVINGFFPSETCRLHSRNSKIRIGKYEALILILMFVAYIVVLFFNARLEYLALLQVREAWLRASVYRHAGDRIGPGEIPCPDESCIDDPYHYHFNIWHMKAGSPPGGDGARMAADDAWNFRCRRLVCLLSASLRDVVLTLTAWS